MLAGYEHLFGGLSGGIASTLICHPLDLLRIRYAGLSLFCMLSNTP